MKKINTIILAIALSLFSFLFITSCSDDESEMAIDPSLLQTNIDTLRFSADGGEAKINVMTLYTWKAVSQNDSWCISKRTGSLLSVTAETNRAETSRTAEVSLLAEGKVVKNIVVIQQGIVPGQALVLSKDQVEISCMEQDAIGIKSVDHWEIDMPKADTTWCKIKKNPMGGVLITVWGNQERSTEINVISGSTKKTFTVRQKKYNFTYQPGELYQDESGELSGIIYRVEGRQGYVVSLLEGHLSFMNPGDPDLTTGFNFINSQHALEIVKERFPDTWHSKFPVLAWCDDLNTRYETTGWRCIASSDIGSNVGDRPGLWQAYDLLLNQKQSITLWGGTPFPDRSLFWEKSVMTIAEYYEEDHVIGQKVYFLDSGGVGVQSRTTLWQVRAVKEFEIPE